MAKQAGPILLSGTIGNVTFVAAGRKGIARMKSSLTKKDVKTKPEFANSRAASERFGTANKLASQVYRSLPKKSRKNPVYLRLKSLAIRLIHQNVDPAEIKASLQKKIPASLNNSKSLTPKARSSGNPGSIKKSKFKE